MGMQYGTPENTLWCHRLGNSNCSTSGRCDSDFETLFFILIKLQNSNLGIRYAMVLKWMPQNLTN